MFLSLHCRTKWIEVLFAFSATGPSVRTTSGMRRYVASTDGWFFAKCDSMLRETDCNCSGDERIRGRVAATHHIERASMSSPLAAVRLSITSDGSSRTVDPSVDTSSPLRRHLSWMASA